MNVWRQEASEAIEPESNVRRGDRVRRDVRVFPFHGVTFFYLEQRRIKFHVFHRHMRDHRRVGVCDRALDALAEAVLV